MRNSAVLMAAGKDKCNNPNRQTKFSRCRYEKIFVSAYTKGPFTR